MKPIHYAGALRVQNKRSYQIILAGWAACCSGERAIEIRRNRQHTHDRSLVTCKACLAKIAKEAKE